MDLKFLHQHQNQKIKMFFSKHPANFEQNTQDLQE